MTAPAKTETMSEAVERLMDERVAQGLPRHITDPLAIATIAGIMANVDRREAETAGGR